MSDYTPKREQDTIDSAVASASKVPGSLTLNELNAISDKGLVVSGGSESVVEQDFDYVLRVLSGDTPELKVVSGNGIELFNALDSTKQDKSSKYWNMAYTLAYVVVEGAEGNVSPFNPYFDTVNDIIILKNSGADPSCFIFHPDGTFEYSTTMPEENEEDPGR